MVASLVAAAALAACAGNGDDQRPSGAESGGNNTETARQGPSEEEIQSEAEAIQRHREEFEQLGARFGRARPGMERREVRSTVGHPDRVTTGMVGGQTVECWRYLELPPGDPAERFARVFRLCFRGGKLTDTQRLLARSTPREVRFLVGAPDSTFRRKLRGLLSRCWRWDYRIAAQTVCFRDGRVVFQRSFA
jgi:hypothetical protein